MISYTKFSKCRPGKASNHRYLYAEQRFQLAYPSLAGRAVNEGDRIWNFGFETCCCDAHNEKVTQIVEIESRPHSTEMTSSSESLSVVMSPTRFPSSAFAIGEM